MFEIRVPKIEILKIKPKIPNPMCNPSYENVGRGWWRASQTTRDGVKRLLILLHTEKSCRILLNQTEIRLYLSFSDYLRTKRTFVWFQINRKMVNTIWCWLNEPESWVDLFVRAHSTTILIFFVKKTTKTILINTYNRYHSVREIFQVLM